MTEHEIARQPAVLREIPSGDGNEDARVARQVSEAPTVLPPAPVAAVGTARVSRMFWAEEHVGALGTFAPTDVELSKHRRQEIARVIFLLMALSLVIPVILI